jgi:hypothetical protein
MAMVTWSPVEALTSLRREMEQLFEDCFGGEIWQRQ